MRRTNTPITPEDLGRAIYLDFEGEDASKRGEEAPDPVLGGVQVDGEYTWTVLSSAFSQVSDHYEVMWQELPRYLEDLICRANEEDRRIVFWTSHEEEVFEEYGFPPNELGFDLKIPVKPHFKDLFRESRAAKKKLFSAPKSIRPKLRQKAFGLCVQCAKQACGMEIPADYGKGFVGERIRYCARQAGSKPNYEAWSPGAKRRWTSLVKHNRVDCEAMRQLASRFVFPAAT